MKDLKRQDRQGVRTPADVERKHGLGKTSAQFAEEAIRAANEAKQAVEEVKAILTNGFIQKAGTLNGALYAVNFTNTGLQTYCTTETPMFTRGHTYLCFANIDGANHTFVLSLQGDKSIRYSNSTMSGPYYLVVDYADAQSVYLKQTIITHDVVTEKYVLAQSDVAKDIRLYFTEIYNEF